MLGRLRDITFSPGLISVVLLPLLAACGESTGAPAVVHPPKPVLVAPIKFADGQDVRTFTAQIKPRIEGSHGFRVAGRVVRRFVDVGSTVKAGDPLAVLDDADFRLQLDQAEAEERAARNVLSHEEAEQARLATLRDKGFTAAAAFDRQKATADEARSRLMRAERAVGLARNALRYATLIAQDDGVVTAVRVEPGQVVDVGAPAFVIAKAGEVEAEIAVPEALVERARTGVATVSLWSAGGKTYAAHLRELAPLADPMTRTFAARYTIAAPDESVRLGLSATLALSAARQPLAAVPLSAVLDQGTGPAVWKADRAGGTLALQPVVIAKFEGQTALLASGVADGDLVVTIGVHKLDPGLKVRPIEQLPR
jgi:RND family efflux transporter MFP subunit